MCLLPDGRLQFALSTMSFGRPVYDQSAGFRIDPTSSSLEAGSTLFLCEYELGLANLERMRTYARLAARMTHVFHLMTNVRETFFKAVAEWESQSEVRKVANSCTMFQ